MAPPAHASFVSFSDVWKVIVGDAPDVPPSCVDHPVAPAAVWMALVVACSALISAPLLLSAAVLDSAIPSGCVRPAQVIDAAGSGYGRIMGAGGCCLPRTPPCLFVQVVRGMLVRCPRFLHDRGKEPA